MTNKTKKSLKFFEPQTLTYYTNMYKRGNDKEKQEAQLYFLSGLKQFKISLISKYYGRFTRANNAGSEHFEDLCSCGDFAILENLKNYDPKKGTPTTFFKPFILHEMQDYVVRNINYNTPHYATANKKKIQFEEEYAKEHNGKKPSLYEIQKHTKIGAKTLKRIEAHKTAVNFFYLDDDEVRETSDIVSRIPTPEEELERKSEIEEVREMVEKLPEIESKVIKMLFEIGDNCYKSFTIDEVAKALNITSDSVQDLQIRAFAKLRKMKDKIDGIKKDDDFDLEFNELSINYNDDFTDQTLL